MATQVNETGIRTFKAGAAVTQYRRVKVDSNGDVIHAGLDEKGIGHALTTVASGDHVAVKLWNHPGTIKITCAAAVDKNDILYAAAAGKYNDDQAGTGAGLVKALEAGSGDDSLIEAMPLDTESSGLVYANIADSASVTNTTTETAFDKSRTIDGSELQVGDVLHVVARAHCVATNATDTLTLKLYLGTEEICTTGAVDVANNDIGFIESWIVIRSTGASGTISATSLVALGVPTTVTAKPVRKDQATEDISGNVAITVKATWSVANAGNDVILEDLIIQKIRQ